ncbi:protein of unknown function (plasmid) [Caballeronia sp. S22]
MQCPRAYFSGEFLLSMRWRLR